MKRFTRLLSIFLAVLMLSGVLTTAASALSFTFDSDNSVTTRNPVKPGPVAPGTDETTSAIVRVYVKGTGTKGYTYTGTIPDNLTSIWVGEGYLLIQPGVRFAGIKPKDIDSNNTVNADTVKKIKESITLPTVSEVVAAVNTKRDAEKLSKWDTADYSGVIVDSIMWESSDSAYHVHLTLVEKGNLVITANSYTYDGQPHSWTCAGLNEGHTVKNIPSYVDAGTYTLNTDTIKIFDASGKDVTDQYKISVSGPLTIIQRPLTITAKSYSVPYDGYSHGENGYDYNGLVPGHTIVKNSVTLSGSGTNEGEYTITVNVDKIKIVDTNDKNVTSNYKIIPVNGTLTITGKQYTPNPEYVDSSITIRKRDSAYQADDMIREEQGRVLDSNGDLPGAWFDLYDSSYVLRSGKYDTKAKPIDSQKTDKYGEATFSKLAEGTYYLVEYSAPSGYIKDNTVYRIDVRVPSGSIDKQLVAFITAENSISSRSITEADGYVIYNDRQQQVVTDTTSFTIVKRDSAWPYDTLSGAWFDLYDSSYVLRSGKYDTKAKPIDSQKTDKYGEATFSKLAAGTYYLVEYSAPSGYTKDSTVYRITVRYPSSSSKLTAFITRDNASDNRSLTEANGYIIYNTKTAASYGTVTVSKEVSGIGTSSKTKYSFEIWEKNGKKALKSFTLTAGSSTTISLDPGSYIIKELDASKVGYELKTYIDGSLSRTGQTSFTVKAGGKTSIAYKNVYAASIDLNTEDHYAYIIGYEDGTVRPNGNLTRAEVATIFFRMLTDDARSKYWCTTNNYTDVSSDDWFNNAVSTLSYAGIINGYSDGSFQPKGTITRAELVKMAMGFFNYTTGSSSSRFTDVGDHWAASYINKAAELGYLDIFGSTFEPNKAITRAEAITIINRVLGRSPHKDYMNIRQTYWSDNPTSAWYYADIQEATNSHDYTWINIYGNQYEEWTGALENRDWAALEKKWSTTYSSHNPGNVW